MADPIGINFVPTDEQALMGRKNMATEGGIPEAVKFISLQIPKFAGARAIAPDALLQAQPTNPVSSVVESVLRSIGIGQTPPESLGGRLGDAVNGRRRRPLQPLGGGLDAIRGLGSGTPRIRPIEPAPVVPETPGGVSREWGPGPSQGSPEELLEAARRSSQGYNEPYQEPADDWRSRKQPWTGEQLF